MIQRIVGRIRLFLLLCGIWGALFFTIANVNSDAWFFPTMDFYVLYRIGHLYVLYLLGRGIIRNREFMRISGIKANQTWTNVVIFLMYLLLIDIIPLGYSSSRWWKTLELPSNTEAYFALHKEWPLHVDPTDLVSFIFLLMCFMICCASTKRLSSIVKQNNSLSVLKYLWPYQKIDIEDIPEFQQHESMMNTFLQDSRLIEKDGAFVKVCCVAAMSGMFIIFSPFILIKGCLNLLLGKRFMLKMVGDFEQAEICEIKITRVRSFFDRISLYTFIIFTILYTTFLVNSVFVNAINVHFQSELFLMGIFITLATIIWAEADNLYATKKIHEQEIFDLSKNNKNWMLLYAHQLINTGQTILADVSLLREEDEPELRLEDLQVNTQHLLDDGELCLNYAQALSKQPVIETIDLIKICEKIITEIEDDKRTASFCTEDDILLEYSEDNATYLVKTDESILQRILYELITNAVLNRISGTAVLITIEKKDTIIHLKIENAVTLMNAEKMQEYLKKINAFWNWQNVSSAGDIRLGLVFTKGYAEMVDIELDYNVNNKITFSANLEVPMA